MFNSKTDKSLRFLSLKNSMGAKNIKGPPRRPIYANESGPRPRKRGKLDKNRGETDDSTDKTSLDDLQCDGTPEQEEEENENEGEEEEYEAPAKKRRVIARRTLRGIAPPVSLRA